MYLFVLEQYVKYLFDCAAKCAVECIIINLINSERKKYSKGDISWAIK